MGQGRMAMFFGCLLLLLDFGDWLRTVGLKQSWRFRVAQYLRGWAIAVVS
jgi:hypothetical protein